jgi:ferredoxin
VSDVSAVSPVVEVWIDQDECTGDGFCVQESPDMFEHDIDGLAYVRDVNGLLQSSRGARVVVPLKLLEEVKTAAKGCPGDCIYVRNAETGEVVAGPE